VRRGLGGTELRLLLRLTKPLTKPYRVPLGLVLFGPVHRKTSVPVKYCTCDRYKAWQFAIDRRDCEDDFLLSKKLGRGTAGSAARRSTVSCGASDSIEICNENRDRMRT
jgi:hypothetical protein